MSIRLPLLGVAAAHAGSAAASTTSRAAGARVRVERRAVTVGARDGRAEPFAKALAEGLLARGWPAVLLDGRSGQDPAAAAAALAEALVAPDTLVVVCHRALAIELEGALDVWIGPPPPASAAESELAAYRSCQLELRANPEPVAHLLAAELAALRQ